MVVLPPQILYRVRWHPKHAVVDVLSYHSDIGSGVFLERPIARVHVSMLGFVYIHMFVYVYIYIYARLI